MKRLPGLAILTMAAVLASMVRAGDAHPAGYWRYGEAPTWIHIVFEEGVGSGVVLRNDKNPHKVGLVLLSGIEPSGRDQQWRVQVYVDRLDAYKPATLSLTDTGEMRILLKVGLISRTLRWQRTTGTEEP